MLSNGLIERKDVPEEFKWKIEDLYVDDDLWQEDYEKLSKSCVSLKDYEGHLTENGKKLYDYLSQKDETELRLSRLYVYANEKSHEDLGNGKYQEMADKIGTLAVKIGSVCAFENPEILKMDEEKLEQFMKDVPKLQLYRHYLEDTLRMKPHTLTSEMEALLSELGDFAESPSTIFAMFNNADIQFPMVKDESGKEVRLTHGNYISFMESKDRDVRKGAFKAMYDTYGRYKNTLAATFASNVKKELFYAGARKYQSPLQMHLDGNAIDTAVYDRLIETVHRYLPAMYDYVALRKKMLGLDEIHMYDLYTPIIPEVSMKFTFEEAKQTVLEGLSVLGDDYTALLKEGFDGGWIDVYENKGKRSGAYSWGTYGVHPYVLLNYQDNLDSVFTLAHEMGHSLHTYYSNQNQAPVNASYCIFVAEVASTCNEVLLTNHLLNTVKDEKEKAYILNHYLDTFKGTLFRQAMFAEFEKKVYEMAASGIPLTADTLCRVYHDLNVLYYGPDMIVDAEIDMEWARIPHFYTPFYVYQYATGISAASAFASAILNEGDDAVKRYKKFLSGGCSKYPLDLLAEAGVDMRTGGPVAGALESFKTVLKDTVLVCLKEG